MMSIAAIRVSTGRISPAATWTSSRSASAATKGSSMVPRKLGPSTEALSASISPIASIRAMAGSCKAAAARPAAAWTEASNGPSGIRVAASWSSVPTAMWCSTARTTSSRRPK